MARRRWQKSSPCTCEAHYTGTDTKIYHHEFLREEWNGYPTTVSEGNFLSVYGWRWVCSCGSKGKIQFQSPNVSYHSWLVHVHKNPPRYYPPVESKL